MVEANDLRMMVRYYNDKNGNSRVKKVKIIGDQVVYRKVGRTLFTNKEKYKKSH